MALEPGLDVVMVGHPFKLGTHSSSAIWKGAMVASDSAGASERSVLLDAPGVPGMSRSPVYHRAIRSSQPFARPERYGYKTGAFGTVRPNKGDLVAIEKEVSLELLRVYAGATGDRRWRLCVWAVCSRSIWSKTCCVDVSGGTTPSHLLSRGQNL
jgi:hypothetical protein